MFLVQVSMNIIGFLRNFVQVTTEVEFSTEELCGNMSGFRSISSYIIICVSASFLFDAFVLVLVVLMKILGLHNLFRKWPMCRIRSVISGSILSR